jgi:hypothetical protein
MAGEPAVDSLREATLKRLKKNQELRAAAGDGWLVVLGEELPWADGVTYLGWDSGILVPTTQRPIPPTAILRGALPSAELTVLLPGLVLLSAAPRRVADPDRLGGG